MWCLDAKTGKEIYGGQRLKPGTYSASPVLADGKIYITNEDGLTTVFKAGPKFEILAENNMNDYCLSTIAISEGQIFLRTGEGSVRDRQAKRLLQTAPRAATNSANPKRR